MAASPSAAKQTPRATASICKIRAGARSAGPKLTTWLHNSTRWAPFEKESPYPSRQGRADGRQHLLIADGRESTKHSAPAPTPLPYSKLTQGKSGPATSAERQYPHLSGAQVAQQYKRQGKTNMQKALSRAPRRKHRQGRLIIHAHWYLSALRSLFNQA